MMVTPATGAVTIVASASGAASSVSRRVTSCSGFEAPVQHHGEHARVRMRRHAVTAHDLEFARDHEVQREGRIGIVAGHQSHLHHATVLAQRFECAARGTA
jgi:hypothetical protein